MANRFPLFTGFVALVCAASVPAQRVEADTSAQRVGFIFAGTFESGDLAKRPEGARRTQYVASYEWDYGVRPFSTEVWEERGLDWERFRPIAQRVADTLASEVDVELVRDHRDVIEYALVRSEDPFLTGVLLSPVFYERLRDKLGDEMHAIVVDRHRFYLFPATGGTLEAYGESIVADFLQTDLPVSLEVMRFDRSGPSVIGELERPSFDE